MKRSTPASRTYWEQIASGLRVSPPLAPVGEDIEWFRSAATRALGSRGGSLALILGVTPGLVALRWPPGTVPVSADWALSMFRHRWPAAGSAAALAADWRRLPLADESVGFACGDGCFTALGNAQSIPEFNQEVARVLRQRGLLCLRCFVRPESPLSAAELVRRLREGQIANPNLFRWLFAMAVQGDSTEGVVLGEAWRTWREHFPDPGELLGLGWDEEALAGFARWKDQTMRYCFHTVAELRSLAAPQFETEAIDVPRYPFGERFPRIAFRKR